MAKKLHNKKINTKILFELYRTFFRLGIIGFGGGYAAIPLMEREVVEEKKWLEKEQLTDTFAVAQSLPGAIALNSSAFLGFSIAGIPGALAALLGNLTPSVIIMSVLSIMFVQFNENIYVQKAFYGIRPVIVGLITFAAYRIAKNSIVDKYCAVIAIITLILALFFNISVIFIILGCIGVGLLVSFLKFRQKKKENN